MKVLLLANQPERTTRLNMFAGTLKSQGHEVIIPSFGTKNWIRIAGLAKKIAKERKPDVVHIFNVPDVIYHSFAKLRGQGFRKLIYDYRSPWGIELAQTFGAPGRIFAEHFERELANSADAITTVNEPLGRKVQGYAPDKKVQVIPNYPHRSFCTKGAKIDSQEFASRAGKRAHCIHRTHLHPGGDWKASGGCPGNTRTGVLDCGQWAFCRLVSLEKAR